MLEPYASKGCMYGSEGAGTQQCLPATRPSEQACRLMTKSLANLSTVLFLLVALTLLSIREQERNAGAAPAKDCGPGKGAKIVFKEDVVYGRVQGAGLLADIAYPEGKGPFPVILSVHGGRWF